MSSIGSRRMNFPSPHGVHVPESYHTSLDSDDPYRRPPTHRNRYSRSVHQTPRIRDVTWVSSPDTVTPQVPHLPQSPWLVPPHTPPSAPRPPSPILPSPVPTVGERMTLDELAFVHDDLAVPYPRPQPRPSLIKSFWKGLKKLSGFQPSTSFPMPRPSGSYKNQIIEMPVPVPSVPSMATQYMDQTPQESSSPEEQRSATPHASPYARPASVGATPGTIPGFRLVSPVPIPLNEAPPPITVVSPSIPSSPLPGSIRSAHVPSPIPSQRNLFIGVHESAGAQTLHEPAYLNLALPVSTPVSIQRIDHVKFASPNDGVVHVPVVDHSSSGSSLSPTMARFRRFITSLDHLPWVADAQIVDEYIPEKNPRSRLRAKVRKGTEPSWYNPRPEIEERHEYWSEWDMWAKQSTAALDGAPEVRIGWAGVNTSGDLGQGQVQWGQWGMAYPHGYTPVQPGQAPVYPLGYPLGTGAVSGEGRTPIMQ